ncbi:MAG TPA: ATP-binding protein, partial [Polyangiaceae bacterium]|nr:ATP-binding protein [Polyangiaceae bacterium]
SSLAERKRIQFSLETPHKTLEAFFDRDKVERILLNLVSNALRFTSEGGKIRIELGVDGEMAEIRVCDTGRGIPTAELPRIFDRFHQVDGSSTREYEGTGIGLALVKELVELHHGSVDVHSRLNFGTEFTVRLPLGKDHLEPTDIVERIGDSVAPPPDAQLYYDDVAPVRAAAPVEENGGGQRILVVEDNDDMRSHIRSVLESAFSVLEAADGREGLERARAAAPDLVVTDVMMPVMDGYQLLAALRADEATRHVPVILLTAKASEETRLAGLESGADDYLTKPFEARELLARARNLLRLKAQERELRELATSLEREVVAQATEIERTRQLARYLPPQVVATILEEGRPVRVEQERCRITAFRIALRGFEALEGLDPEDVTALLNNYLSAMAEVAFEHGATLDRFVGDTVIGFFGAPTSEGAEADALRAVRTAVAMVERARRVCTDWQDFLADRLPRATAVVSSGHATVGNFGSASRLEYTAIGAPVSESAALLPLVAAGDVVCTQATWALVRDQMDDNLGTLSVVVQDRTMRLQLLMAPAEEEPKSRTLRDAVPDRTQRVIDPRNLVGVVIGDRYRVVRRLGTGGMAVVYQAQDLKLGTDVALKLVIHSSSEAGLASSLDREVKLARLITHANVARIYDLGMFEGVEFISMELVEGTALEERLEEGLIPLDEGRDILLQVCAGLEAAHAAKIVHRDLKPSNIMLGD